MRAGFGHRSLVAAGHSVQVGFQRHPAAPAMPAAWLTRPTGSALDEPLDIFNP
jgi:hypothetical protein